MPEELFPGKYYTLLFEVLNTSSDTLTINCKFELPLEFKSIISNKKITLKPNSKKNVIFTFGVSKYCPSGDFKTAIHLFSEETKILSKKAIFKVSKFHNIAVEILKHPEYLRLEKDFFCEYLVANYGNSSEKIDFLSKNAYKVLPNSVILKPDSSVIVKVFQKVPQNLYSKTTVLNNLKAKLILYDTVFSNRIPITVYPNSNKSPDLYKRFPISFSTIFNSVKGTDTISVLKYRVSGRGFLDKNDNHYLSFNYSGPNSSDIVRFGEYEEYTILYRNSQFEATAGDVNFSLSNLTETSRYGIGSIFKYKFTNATASLFYVKPRFTNQISDSYGGKIVYNLSDKTYLQFGVINRSLFEDEENFMSQIYSLESSFTGDKLKLKSEVAFENNYKSNGFAASLDAYFNYKNLFLGNVIQFSDKKYKGYLRNSKQLHSTLRYNFSKKIQTQISTNYTSINPVNDTINYTSSPILTKHQIFVNYKINKQNKIKIGGYIRKKEDRFFPKKYNFEENLLSFYYQNRKVRAYDFNIYNKYGTTVNYLIEGAPSQKVFFSSMQFSMNITKNFIYGINGTYQQTNKQSEDNKLIESFYYGGFLRYNFKSYLDLNLYYKNDYDFDELDDAQSYLEARLNFNYKQKHLLSLSVSQSSLPIAPLKKELFISASYNFVINVPILKDKTVGSVKGKIISNENDNLEGVLVLLDDKISITNKKGEFNFYSLKAKMYTLSVKQSSLPKAKIIIEDTPYKINVVPNKESYITLHLGKTGNLIGKIKFKKTTKIQSEKFIKKLPKLIVKISKGNAKFLTKTDNLGNFEFRELSPGVWTVELLIKNLVKDFKFEKIKTTIEIISNKNSTAIFNVSNKNRTIKKSKKTFKL